MVNWLDYLTFYVFLKSAKRLIYIYYVCVDVYCCVSDTTSIALHFQTEQDAGAKDKELTVALERMHKYERVCLITISFCQCLFLCCSKCCIYTHRYLNIGLVF